MICSENPWVDRFEDIDNAVIRERLWHIPTLPEGFDNKPLEVSCKQLKKALTELFVPTEQVVEIVSKLVGLAHAHSATHYENKTLFLRKIYSEDYGFSDSIRPYNLTGSTGQGKTSIFKSLHRVMPKQDQICFEKHSMFPLDAVWQFTIPGTIPLSKLLLQMLGDDADVVRKKTDIVELIEKCRWKAYRNGKCIILIDEMQFLTSSPNANTLIAQFLMHVASIGLPVVYIGNFSLGHKLKKRPPQDRERLLANPLILLPDEPDSTDWKLTLQYYQAVCPDIFQFDFVEAAQKIFGWTAGSKRMLKRLLIKAYRRSRERNAKIDLEDLGNIFQSIAFAGNREQVNQMLELFVTGESRNRDLVCPYELPANSYKKHKDLVEAVRRTEVVQSLATSTLNHGENQLYEELNQKVRSSPSANVTPIRKGKKDKLTVEQLKEAEKHL